MKNVAIGFVLGVAMTAGAMAIHDFGRPKTETEHQIVEALTVQAAQVETVTVYRERATEARAESDRLGELVQAVGPATLSIRVTPTASPVLAQVHPMVVAKMRADSLTIARQADENRQLRLLVVADSGVIRLQAMRIHELEGGRCGRKCGMGIGVGFTVVLVWMAKAVIGGGE